MPAANIEINGVAGSNINLPINTLVQLSNADVGGELTYQWEITDQPDGAADALSNALIENPTFTPRKEGTYRLRLTVNVGTGTETIGTVVAAIRNLKTNLREPAAGETNEADNADGWKKDLNVAIAKLDDVASDSNVVVCKLPGAAVPAVGDVVRFSSTGLIKTGLPGEERMLVIEQAPANVPTIRTAEIGVVIGTPTGVAPAANGLALVRRWGLVEVSEAGAPAVGDYVYTSDTFQPSLVPGTFARSIGRVVESAAGVWRWLIDGVAPGAGGGFTRVEYIATGAEGTSFMVPIGMTLASDDYDPVLSPQLVAVYPAHDFPDEVAGDRTTTQFRMRCAVAPTAGDKFNFILFQ